jgi:lipopolysaccharide export LptBFGC system permease protein LptF
VKRFDRYFLWVFVQSLALVLALFTTVFLVVDVLLNLEKIQDFPDIAQGTTLFYAFNLPPILYLLYPLMLFTAGMFAVARLIRSRELLLMEAAGVSRKRALAAITISVLLLGVGGLGLRELVLPQLAQAARESPYGAFEFRKGRRISVRDDGGNVWFVRRYNLDSRTLEDVRILSADGNRMIAADELTWIEERARWWAPKPGRIHDLAGLTGAQATQGDAGSFDGDLPFGELYPADFARRRRSYSDRTLTQLWLDAQQNIEDRELRVNLWHELWYPMGGFILLMCGVGLILTRTGRGIFFSSSLALASVVGYQILVFWFETLAQSGAWPAFVGASAAPLMFGAFGAIVFTRT